MEIWKEIQESSNYEISNKGRFRNKRGLILKCNVNARGYVYCNISINGKVKKVKIHKLVAQAFIFKSDNNQTDVNHKDLNKLNNHCDNLEWLTHLENVRHYYNSLK